MSLVQNPAIVDTLNQVQQQPVALATTDDLNLLELLMKGGWIMIPILLLFFLGLVIFFERYITIRKASKSESGLLASVKSSVLSGKIDAAMAACRSNNSALSRMLREGLSSGGPPIKANEGAHENSRNMADRCLQKN